MNMNWQDKIKEIVNKLLNMSPRTTQLFGAFNVYFYTDEVGGHWEIIDNDERTITTLHADNYYNDEQFTNDLINIIF